MTMASSLAAPLSHARAIARTALARSASAHPRRGPERVGSYSFAGFPCGIRRETWSPRSASSGPARRAGGSVRVMAASSDDIVPAYFYDADALLDRSGAFNLPTHTRRPRLP